MILRWTTESGATPILTALNSFYFFVWNIMVSMNNNTECVTLCIVCLISLTKTAKLCTCIISIYYNLVAKIALPALRGIIRRYTVAVLVLHLQKISPVIMKKGPPRPQQANYLKTYRPIQFSHLSLAQSILLRFKLPFLLFNRLHHLTKRRCWVPVQNHCVFLLLIN